jgi:RNA polymerase sigma factor (sigma-70 family)
MTPEERARANLALRDRIRDLLAHPGDDLQPALAAARDELIRLNSPLVTTIAEDFFWPPGLNPPPSFTELFSYGLEGLWKASLNIHKMTHDEVGRYLARYIKGAMKRRGKEYHPFHKLNFRRKEKKRYLKQYRPKDDDPAPDEQAVVDRWDLILASCEDDDDRRIVQLRRENESYSSIGTILGMSKATVCDRLKKIEKRMKLAERCNPNPSGYKCRESRTNSEENLTMTVAQFLDAVTEAAPGVATSVAKFRKRYEREHGGVNRSVFINALGAAGCRLNSTGPSIVLVLDRRLKA